VDQPERMELGPCWCRAACSLPHSCPARRPPSSVLRTRGTYASGTLLLCHPSLIPHPASRIPHALGTQPARIDAPRSAPGNARSKSGPNQEMPLADPPMPPPSLPLSIRALASQRSSGRPCPIASPIATTPHRVPPLQGPARMGMQHDFAPGKIAVPLTAPPSTSCEPWQ
jgi:hypothetical protein